MAERMIDQPAVMPSGGVEVDLYTCPAGFESVLSSIVVCNTSDTVGAKFRVRKSYLGAASALNQSNWHNQDIGPDETMVLSPAMTLTASSKVRVQSDTGSVVFDVNGTEVS